MFYECLKQGIKNRNSALNRAGKSAFFVLTRVRVLGAGPHLPIQGYIKYPPPPPPGPPSSICHFVLEENLLHSNSKLQYGQSRQIRKLVKWSLTRGEKQ